MTRERKKTQKTEDELLRAKAIGERIARARREKDGMTQRELSLSFTPPLTERSIAEWESGRVIPYKHMRDLGRLLGRPASWFLYGEEGNNGHSERSEMDEFRSLLEEHSRQLAEIITLLKKRK